MSEEELPILTEHGLLPEGIHRLTLDQVEALFGSFQKSERRCRLFEKLKLLVGDCKLAGWVIAVIIDGSFVMRCVDEPDDIDLMVLLPTDWDFRADLRPFEYNLLSRKRTKRLYGFDVFRVAVSSAEEANLAGFFAGINPKWNEVPLFLPRGIKKGLVRIDL